MTTHHIAVPALIFNGVEIHDRNEMLCLTDMWRAAGAVEAKRPSNWTRKEGAEFIEHVSLILNVPHGHIQTQRGGSGAGRGATFAHWQIGLAYAKYLSPEFHMWCNTVVRERMEGKPVAPAFVLDETQKNAIGGIVKGVLAKQLESVVPALVSHLLPTAVAGYIADHNLALADGLTAGEVCDLAKVATTYPRGVSGRVSARLTKFCQRNGERPRISRLGRVRAQLFPTHLVRDWLDVEGRALIRRWIDEKKGQGALKLVPKS
ncbi:hypothetical protein Xaut_3646 [Xanthobacter versatilis]|uniref:KilA-N domain-containing protein n=1 Tax=Xanthobacter autotrophicus (strain ATCC BAA-1158 / Py2) TaxID=78245 RepID=A7ILI1_XANP2|nr:hypothetical protein Xaut_3646 [Xanthobacter autotrophicus Py2]